MTARSRPAHYDPGDFARLRPVEDGHFWFVSRNNILGAVLATLAGEVPRAGAVLEIGCGTGNTLRVLRDMLPDSTLVGMDALHAGLLHARDRTPASLVEGRLEEMPFRKQFVLVGMFDVLEHIEDDVTGLGLIHEVLQPSGALMLTVPADPSLWSRCDEEWHHQRRYTEPQLRKVLSEARFHVEYITHFMSVTYPALWLSRRLARLRGAMAADPQPAAGVATMQEVQVTGFLNKLFGLLLRVEVPVIRRRYRLPVGASLLAIARV